MAAGDIGWEEAARRKKDMDDRFTLVDRWRVAKAGVPWHRCRFERNLEPLLVEMEKQRGEKFREAAPGPLRKAKGLPSLEMAAARTILKLAGRQGKAKETSYTARRVACHRMSEYRKSIAEAVRHGWIDDNEGSALVDGLDDILIAIGEISSEPPDVPAAYRI